MLFEASRELISRKGIAIAWQLDCFGCFVTHRIVAIGSGGGFV